MGSISLHMRHFPEKDPKKLDNNEARFEIDQQVQEYLSRGGAITYCDSSEMQKSKVHCSQEEMRQIKRKSYTYGAGKKFTNTLE